MNSRRFNWSNGIRSPTSRDRTPRYRIGEDQSAGTAGSLIASDYCCGMNVFPDGPIPVYHLAVLRPGEVRSLWRLVVEGACRIGPELALIPFVAAAEVERPRQHHNGTHLIGMPMRRVLPAG